MSSLNVVNDQLLEIQLKAEPSAGGAALRVIFDNGRRETGAEWDLQHRTLKLLGESSRAAAPAADRWTTLHVGCFDGQQLVAVDGRVVLRGSWPQRGPGSPRPWRLESRDSDIEIRRLRIWRDLHYEVPYAGRSRWQLTARQWLLIGDNVPTSWDSRQTGPVEHQQLLGRLLR